MALDQIFGAILADLLLATGFNNWEETAVKYPYYSARMTNVLSPDLRFEPTENREQSHVENPSSVVGRRSS